MAKSRFIAIYSSDPRSTLSIARSFSPRVEKHLSGAVLFPVSKRYEEQVFDRLLQISIHTEPLHFGLASSRTVAVLAARLKPGSRVPERQTSQFIRAFSIEHLFALHSFSDGALETLQRWGIRRIGLLADLPQSQLIARMGEEGLQLQRLARGRDLKPFEPVTEPPRFIAVEELQWEIEDLEPLTFLFGKLLEQLCRQLEDHGLATNCLDLQLGLANGDRYRQSIPLAFPMRNSKPLLSLLRLKLQSKNPTAPISRVELEAQPSRPQIFQHSLLEPNQTHPEKFSRTLSRLNALTGESHLGTAVLADTHQPDRYQLTTFPAVPEKSSTSLSLENPGGVRVKLVLRRLRPPQPIEVHTHRIVGCSGPWRSSGNWWEMERVQEPGNSDRDCSWSRDEWDIEMVDGVVYRIYWDELVRKHFVEGIYD